jgi:hypothetical protein
MKKNCMNAMPLEVTQISQICGTAPTKISSYGHHIKYSHKIMNHGMTKTLFLEWHHQCTAATCNSSHAASLGNPCGHEYI